MKPNTILNEIIEYTPYLQTFCKMYRQFKLGYCSNFRKTKITISRLCF